MKTFVKENWYKLMIGCSMFIFSVSALIYSVAPARAEGILKEKNINGLYSWTYVVDSQNRVWSHSDGNSPSYGWEIVATLK
jgi:hypothetical protein